MPRVSVHRTTAGAPHHQALIHSQKPPSRPHKLRRCDDPGRVNASRPQEGGGTWSRLASKLPVSFSPCGSPIPRGSVVSGSFSRDATYLSYRTRFTKFPICFGLCWSPSFRRRVLAALPQLTALRRPALLLACSEGFAPPAFRHDVRHGFLRNPVHVAEVLQMRRTRSETGNPSGLSRLYCPRD